MTSASDKIYIVAGRHKEFRDWCKAHPQQAPFAEFVTGVEMIVDSEIIQVTMVGTAARRPDLLEIRRELEANQRRLRRRYRS